MHHATPIKKYFEKRPANKVFSFNGWRADRDCNSKQHLIIQLKFTQCSFQYVCNSI